MHTTASLLLDINVSPKIIQEILGRSDFEMTLGIYSHVLPGIHGIHAEAMEKMDQLFKNTNDENPEKDEELKVE